MNAAGQHLGTILTEVEHTTNVAWGGDDWRTLFVTTLRDSGPHPTEDTRPAGSGSGGIKPLSF